MRLMDTPPSIEKGEITDKGSINQRAVLAHRAACIDAMYEQTSGDALLILAGEQDR
jgi:feruloyl-CoA synthase